MRTYGNKIALSKNSRGVYSIDPILGCSSGMANNQNGCYNDCYAYRISRIYGYDFSKSILRDFESKKHIEEIKKEINKINMPFVRMGTMGDPSENWSHTIKICKLLQSEENILFNKEFFKKKQIVIITKHWNNLTKSQLEEISNLNICINTSISVLDDKKLLWNSLKQYLRLRKYCKSVLRIVSADFNLSNPLGDHYHKLQNKIMKRYKCLDTVLRVRPKNPYVIEDLINISQGKFLGKNSYLSKANKRAYVGKCGTCKDMCGVNF